LGLGSGTVFDILRPFNARARKRARAAGHRQHGLGKNPFQLGGSFLFAPGDVDLIARPSRTFGDNATPEEVLAALATRT